MTPQEGGAVLPGFETRFPRPSEWRGMRRASYDSQQLLGRIPLPVSYWSATGVAGSGRMAFPRYLQKYEEIPRPRQGRPQSGPPAHRRLLEPNTGAADGVPNEHTIICRAKLAPNPHVGVLGCGTRVLRVLNQGRTRATWERQADRGATCQGTRKGKNQDEKCGSQRRSCPLH